MRDLDLAEYIINTSAKDLSNLELQKMLYRVELDYYKITKKHLIDDDFEAWDFGTILPAVYWKYRKWGALSLDKTQSGILNLPKNEIEIINQIVINCNKKGYYQMVKENQKQGGAWEITINKGLKVIDKELIALEAIQELKESERVNFEKISQCINELLIRLDILTRELNILRLDLVYSKEKIKQEQENKKRWWKKWK